MRKLPTPFNTALVFCLGLGSASTGFAEQNPFGRPQNATWNVSSEWDYPAYFAPGQRPQRPTGGDFTSVIDTYGPLVVRVGEFDAESTKKPWSSWWYPTRDSTLFQSDAGPGQSPLEKFDQYALNRGFGTPDSHTFERTHLYEPNAEFWSGLCDAWAVSSLFVPEPTAPVQYETIRFEVGDLKALAIKSYEQVEGLTYFGQKNEGNWNDFYEDVYPEQFHKFVQKQIYEQHRPFIMDYDPGVQVWNVPVFKASMKIVTEPEHTNVLKVTTWLVSADSLTNTRNLNFVGTDEVVREYHYELYGTPRSDGSFLVDFGIWRDNSRQDHPDYLIAVPDQLTSHKSRNTELSSDVVDLILQGQ